MSTIKKPTTEELSDLVEAGSISRSKAAVIRGAGWNAMIWNWSDLYSHLAAVVADMYDRRGLGAPLGEFVETLVKDEGFLARVQYASKSGYLPPPVATQRNRWVQLSWAWGIIIAALVGILGLIVLTGCSTTHGATGIRGETSASIDSALHRGVTTRDEVFKSYGTPTVVVRESSGGSVLFYQFSHTEIKAGSFVPIAGLFIGGGTAEVKQLSIYLDDSGVVQKWVWTGTQDFTRSSSNH